MSCLDTIFASANVSGALNSPFTTSLLGSLAGAFGGAWAAQRIAEKSKNAEQLLSKINATNTAITLSFSVCNRFMSIKKELYREYYENYLRDQKRFHEVFQAEAPPENGPEEFVLNMRIFYKPLLPVSELQQTIAEKLSANGILLALPIQLAMVADGIERLLDSHRGFIEMIRAIPDDGMNAKTYFYFGKLSPNGGGSTEFPDTLSGINQHIDDGIFFSHLLCEELMQVGGKYLADYKKIKKDTEDRISTVDFQNIMHENLIPSKELYQDWLKAFKSNTPKEKKRKKYWFYGLKSFCEIHSKKPD
ncbi:hypothetical protein [Chromobacterium violaceum]|uniref:hypothetical protein n=1 Tax=Chromobacterium violaceum TaxID=536 RepID=UPI0012D2AEB8|nr:hypothetical protein [Chromobacterium violaceum]